MSLLLIAVSASVGGGWHQGPSPATLPLAADRVVGLSPDRSEGKARPDPLALAPYVGTWRSHGFSLQIGADGKATATWNAGPCGQSGLCTGRAEITFSAERNKATGTYRSVVYKDERGNTVSMDPGEIEGPAVGDKIILEPFENDVLKVAFDPPVEAGNPYLCGPDASPAWRHQCNA